MAPDDPGSVQPDAAETGARSVDGTERKVLDLFAGTGGFSAAFEDADGWDVTTVELNPDHDPDIQADVLDLTAEDLGTDYDLVLASPPCTAFSLAACSTHFTADRRPKTETARNGLQLVYHTLGLIRAIDSEWWFLENPRALMRHFIGEPEGEVWWCQYGDQAAKPTDLWGDHPPSFEYRTCWNGNDNCHHEPAPRGSSGGTQGKSGAKTRAAVPYGLSEAILEAVENPEPVQTTLFARADGGETPESQDTDTDQSGGGADGE